MEHIGKTLEKFASQRTIADQGSKEESMAERAVGETMAKLERLNISSLSHTLESFDKVKGTEEAYRTFSELAEGNLGKKFVLCYGTTGCGKTRLIEGLLVAWARRGIWCRYQTFSQLMRHLKQAMRAGSMPPYDAVFERICGRERLIVDDVGMGTIGSDWEMAELEDIINERYQLRFRNDGKVTILATNRDIKELPDRIVSRFYDPEVGVIVFISAGDYRKQEWLKRQKKA